MRIARLIVNDGFLLNAFLGHWQSEMNDPVGIGRRREHADFQRVQAFTRVAVTEFREMLASLLVDLNFVVPQTAFFVA